MKKHFYYLVQDLSTMKHKVIRTTNLGGFMEKASAKYIIQKYIPHSLPRCSKNKQVCIENEIEHIYTTVLNCI